MENLTDKTILITGAAYRLGKVMALAAARQGANVIIHHGHSAAEAEATASEIRALGRSAWVLQADLNLTDDTQQLVLKANALSPLYALVNSASVFTPGGFLETSLVTWQENININLTAPFILSQEFIKAHIKDQPGRIINLLDWRALRPGRDHFAYTIAKAGLAAMTKSVALAAAPSITVNAIALGAILPPSDGNNENILQPVPAKRWANLSELEETVLFLLSGPAYITGEIIHLDGGRHLV
ncbi:3-oxoacyl-[acyl-carrier-protein] reductase [bioreactor metagenome]|uniref:3-oxoacyl-[acyl-carrier-protein] reductase n=1 Tax=bioreactor metagenome TaxID=1076179 RepID=A0A644ZDJ5_9ZZZZ